MKKHEQFSGRTLLLMGSKAFKAGALPIRVKRKIDEAMSRNMAIIVGEAPGSCRLYQDYLKPKAYAKVTVGHARSMRYNAGNWKTTQYGVDVHQRERSMIEACDSAIVIWTDKSGVIAENLELLKRLDRPTFLYECLTVSKTASAGWLDPKRIYDPYYLMKEQFRKKKESEGRLPEEDCRCKGKG